MRDQVPLSILTFERAPPIFSWLWIFAPAICLVFILFVANEFYLQRQGLSYSSSDSPAKWARLRSRASQLGKKAIILVGGSRILLDIDQSELQKETGLEPVQLAILGSPSANVLEDLATDRSITGTIIFDYSDWGVGVSGQGAIHYEQYYDMFWRDRFRPPPSAITEELLSEELRTHFLSYSGINSPILSILLTFNPGLIEGQFIFDQRTREMSVNFSAAVIKDVYYRKVAGELGLDWRSIPPDAEQILKSKTFELNPPTEAPAFSIQLLKLKQQVAAIHQHGGRIYFVAAPTSGMVKEIESIQHPTDLFWNKFVSEVGAPAIRSNDLNQLNGFICPDGSHLQAEQNEESTKIGSPLYAAMKYYSDQQRNEFVSPSASDCAHDLSA